MFIEFNSVRNFIETKTRNIFINFSHSKMISDGLRAMQNHAYTFQNTIIITRDIVSGKMLRVEYYKTLWSSWNIRNINRLGPALPMSKSKRLSSFPVTVPFVSLLQQQKHQRWQTVSHHRISISSIEHIARLSAQLTDWTQANPNASNTTNHTHKILILQFHFVSALTSSMALCRRQHCHLFIVPSLSWTLCYCYCQKLKDRCLVFKKKKKHTKNEF